MAETTRSTFSRQTHVGLSIHAPAETIWRLLTDAPGYPSWTSTVTSLEGVIEPGGKLRLRSSLDPKRTFKLSVKEFQPPTKLVWGDAMGKRTYSVTESDDGSCEFSMAEKIGGPFFPLFARMIPSFDESFDQFAADLKRAAESQSA